VRGSYDAGTLSRDSPAAVADSPITPQNVAMKLQVPFLQLPLAFDAEALAAEVGAIPESSWRPHPQGFFGNDALTLITTGGDADNDALSGVMRPTAHLERCPYLMQVLDSVGATWGRTRLMRLSGQAEVTPHVDIHYYWRERVRVHVPIVTQPTVRFICGDAELNMRAGECWIFDTWRMHNVINDHALPRIHLVADTVGGEGFWKHLASARPHDRQIPGWQPRLIAPRGDIRPTLDYESRNIPIVMTPWEMREHIVFFLGEAARQPQLQAVHQTLLRLSRNWAALWSCFGEDRAGWPRYRAAIEDARREVVAGGAGQLALVNGMSFLQAFSAAVLDVALADQAVSMDADTRERPA